MLVFRTILPMVYCTLERAVSNSVQQVSSKMPVVRIELYKGRTREQKAAVAREITEVIAKNMGIKSEHTHVLFFDVEKSDWATAGKLSDN